MIFINKTVVENQHLTKDGFITYLQLLYLHSKSNYGDGNDFVRYVNYDLLNYTFTGNRNANRKDKDLISKGINNLVELGVVSLIDDTKITSGVYYIDFSSLTVDTKIDKYIAIYKGDINTILSSNYKNKNNIIIYFVKLIGTINNQIAIFDNNEKRTNVVGTLLLESLATVTGFSTSSIVRYNKTLEELELIYIARQDDFYLIDGKLKNLSNVYGRYKDKDFIEAFAVDKKKYADSHKFVKNTKGAANNKRRLAQQYLALCRGKEYSISEIREIYEYVLTENSTFQKLYKQTKHDKYLESIRDITVFNRYL